MKILYLPGLILALSVLAVCASAQNAPAPQIADSFAPVVRAAAVPVVPIPEPPIQHKFFDRQQLLAFYIHAGMRAVDTIKTCRELSHGGHEDWIPTQQCGGIAAWQAGSVGLTLGVGWMFHKHGNHRLERITPWVGTSASAAGWTKSVFNIH